MHDYTILTAGNEHIGPLSGVTAQPIPLVRCNDLICKVCGKSPRSIEQAVGHISHRGDTVNLIASVIHCCGEPERTIIRFSPRRSQFYFPPMEGYEVRASQKALPGGDQPRIGNPNRLRKKRPARLRTIDLTRIYPMPMMLTYPRPVALLL